METEIQKPAKATETNPTKLLVEAAKFVEELKDRRTQLGDQKFLFKQKKKPFESQSQETISGFKDHIEVLENRVDDSYNISVEYHYDCIMFVLQKNHPKVKVDDPVGAIAEYMKEQGSKGEPNQAELTAADTNCVEEAPLSTVDERELISYWDKADTSTGNKPDFPAST